MGHWLDEFDERSAEQNNRPQPELPDPRVRRSSRRKQRDPMEVFGKIVAWAVCVGLLAIVLAGFVRLFIWIVSGI